MRTTFAEWLDAAGQTISAYATRTGMRYNAVRRFAGVVRPAHDQRGKMMNIQMAQAISADTGIPVGTLVEEALAAAEEPTPPRPYHKRRKGAGDAAVEG